MNANEPRPPREDTGRQPDSFQAKAILTSKELEVLELLSFGYENRDIASHFRTSGQAVKNMLRTINLKLGADNRTHAVAVCFRNGWLPNKDGSEEGGTSKVQLRSGRVRSAPRCTRRRYPDGTVASVCGECGLFIARAWRATDLLSADRNHICQPAERRHKVRFIMNTVQSATDS
ncbi:MAG TPA: LuxR C-terminal-related transcriptional regulator [Terriglobales bacterium]|jgi:DNA-binding CsgD family transcriptional regulator